MSLAGAQRLLRWVDRRAREREVEDEWVEWTWHLSMDFYPAIRREIERVDGVIEEMEGGVLGIQDIRIEGATAKIPNRTPLYMVLYDGVNDDILTIIANVNIIPLSWRWWFALDHMWPEFQMPEPGVPAGVLSYTFTFNDEFNARVDWLSRESVLRASAGSYFIGENPTPWVPLIDVPTSSIPRVAKYEDVGTIEFGGIEISNPNALRARTYHYRIRALPGLAPFSMGEWEDKPVAPLSVSSSARELIRWVDRHGNGFYTGDWSALDFAWGMEAGLFSAFMERAKRLGIEFEPPLPEEVLGESNDYLYNIEHQAPTRATAQFHRQFPLGAGLKLYDYLEQDQPPFHPRSLAFVASSNLVPISWRWREVNRLLAMQSSLPDAEWIGEPGSLLRIRIRTRWAGAREQFFYLSQPIANLAQTWTLEVDGNQPLQQRERKVEGSPAWERQPGWLRYESFRNQYLAGFPGFGSIFFGPVFTLSDNAQAPAYLDILIEPAGSAAKAQARDAPFSPRIERSIPRTPSHHSTYTPPKRPPYLEVGVLIAGAWFLSSLALGAAAAIWRATRKKPKKRRRRRKR